MSKAACQQCRSAHKKCNGEIPCQRCIDLGIQTECYFPSPKKRGRPKKNAVSGEFGQSASKSSANGGSSRKSKGGSKQDRSYDVGPEGEVLMTYSEDESDGAMRQGSASPAGEGAGSSRKKAKKASRQNSHPHDPMVAAMATAAGPGAVPPGSFSAGIPVVGMANHMAMMGIPAMTIPPMAYPMASPLFPGVHAMHQAMAGMAKASASGAVQNPVAISTPQHAIPVARFPTYAPGAVLTPMSLAARLNGDDTISPVVVPQRTSPLPMGSAESSPSFVGNLGSGGHRKPVSVSYLTKGGSSTGIPSTPGGGSSSGRPSVDGVFAIPAGAVTPGAGAGSGSGSAKKMPLRMMASSFTDLEELEDSESKAAASGVSGHGQNASQYQGGQHQQSGATPGVMASPSAGHGTVGHATSEEVGAIETPSHGSGGLVTPGVVTSAASSGVTSGPFAVVQPSSSGHLGAGLITPTMRNVPSTSRFFGSRDNLYSLGDMEQYYNVDAAASAFSFPGLRPNPSSSSSNALGFGRNMSNSKIFDSQDDLSNM